MSFTGNPHHESDDGDLPYWIDPIDYAAARREKAHRNGGNNINEQPAHPYKDLAARIQADRDLDRETRDAIRADRTQVWVEATQDFDWRPSVYRYATSTRAERARCNDNWTKEMHRTLLHDAGSMESPDPRLLPLPSWARRPSARSRDRQLDEPIVTHSDNLEASASVDHDEIYIDEEDSDECEDPIDDWDLDDLEDPSDDDSPNNNEDAKDGDHREESESNFDSSDMEGVSRREDYAAVVTEDIAPDGEEPSMPEQELEAVSETIPGPHAAEHATNRMDEQMSRGEEAHHPDIRRLGLLLTLLEVFAQHRLERHTRFHDDYRLDALVHFEWRVYGWLHTFSLSRERYIVWGPFDLIDRELFTVRLIEHIIRQIFEEGMTYGIYTDEFMGDILETLRIVDVNLGENTTELAGQRDDRLRRHIL